ncbi:Cu(I)-responsive transcriptional regulator, partial [Pseudomonas fragi]|nr:Cu(I)-responsive transcriptional regulator [Pseudomonas sp. GC01]
KIAELQAMAQTLESLASHCRGNDRPDCPIIAGLAELNALAAAPQAPRRTPRFGLDTPASAHQRQFAEK